MCVEERGGSEDTEEKSAAGRAGCHLAKRGTELKARNAGTNISEDRGH